jgi:hypothetical protein
LRLRKSLTARRRFSVEYLGRGVFLYTCQTCGLAEEQEMVGPDGRLLYGGDDRALEKFARYQDQGSGVQGVCKRCTQRYRDERYPL